MISQRWFVDNSYINAKRIFGFVALLLACVGVGVLIAADNRFLYLILGGVGIIGYAILSYERPFAALYILVVCALSIWLSTLRLVGEISPLIGLGGIFTGAWLLRLAIHRATLVNVKEYYLLIGFIGVLIISSISNIDGPAGISPVFTYVQLFLLFILVVNHISSPSQLYQLNSAIIVSSILLALIILMDQAGLLPEAIIRQQFANVDVNGSQELISRTGGLWGDANFTAMQLTIALPLIIERWFMVHSWLMRLLLLAITGVILGAFAFTFSTGGLIGLAVILIVWINQNFRRGRLGQSLRLILLSLIVIGIAISFMPELYRQRVILKLEVAMDAINTGDHNLLLELGTHRGDTWQSAFRVIEDSPLWGYGPGNSAYKNVQYSVFYGDKERIAAHNMYLTIASDLGLLGLVFFVVLLFAALTAVRQKNRNSVFLYSNTALFMALSAYLVQGVAIDIHTQKQLWILIGMALAFRELNKSNKVLHAT